MKGFFKTVAATWFALTLFLCGLIFSSIVFLATLTATTANKQKPTIHPGTFLVFDLANPINDAPPEVDGSALTALLLGEDEVAPLQHRQIVRAIYSAAGDKDIAGVVIKGSMAMGGGCGFGGLREIRAALTSVREAGKPVLVYADFVGTRDYYLMSVATDFVMHPHGSLMAPGLSVEPMFLAGTFEKFGIGVQVVRAGAYKNYAETYTRRNFSPESREELTALLRDIWSEVVATAAQTRGLDPLDLLEALDAPAMIRADVAATKKLIDRTAHWDEVLAELRTKNASAETAQPLHQVSVEDYIALMPAEASGTGAKIAILYAEGAIVDGKTMPGYVGGDDYAKEIRRLRNDPEIKAVVLRVNSPGGSSSASEVIRRELELLAAQKLLVVSMSSVAASGGYWISTPAERIFAERSSITGSIGVVGMFFNFEKMLGDVGASFDSVRTGKNRSDFFDITRTKTQSELAAWQASVDWTYAEFLQHVTRGRKLDAANAKNFAEGRVWSGSEALKLGLVDELGGISQALRYATEKAGLSTDCDITEYPRAKDFAELLRELFENKTDELSQTDPLSRAIRMFESEAKQLRAFNDRRNIYAILPFDPRLN